MTLWDDSLVEDRMIQNTGCVLDAGPEEVGTVLQTTPAVRNRLVPVLRERNIHPVNDSLLE